MGGPTGEGGLVLRNAWLVEGLTDMPEDDLRTIADFLGIPLHTVQAVVWMTEWRCAERAAESGCQPAPRMMHGRSRSGLTVSEQVHPWEPDCDERGCIPAGDHPGDDPERAS